MSSFVLRLTKSSLEQSFWAHFFGGVCLLCVYVGKERIVFLSIELAIHNFQVAREKKIRHSEGKEETKRKTDIPYLICGTILVGRGCCLKASVLLSQRAVNR